MHQFGWLSAMLQKGGGGGGVPSEKGGSNPGGNYGIILLIHATYSYNEAKSNRKKSSSL